MESRKKTPRKALALLGKALGILLSLAVLFGLYLTLVIAQPQTDGKQAQETAGTRVEATAEMRITSEGELRRLAETCPGPVMSFMSGSGMVFVSGETKNASWQGGNGKILTLYWQTGEGDPLILRSIYPAEALDLMGKGDYSFSEVAGPALFGQTSVRMENGDTIRVHVQAEGRGLYVLIVPASLRGSLAGISRSIQLFTAE